MLRRAVAAAPELGSARVALAERIASQGSSTESIALLRGAPAPDRDVLMALARFERDAGDLAAAEKTLRAAAGLAPDDPEAAAALADVLAALDLRALPEQLRAIRAASRITRAELAALLVLRVSALRTLRGAPPEVASDLGRTWAREYALRAIELDLLEVHPNHTFQPNGVVRRGELARAAARVLDLVRWPVTAAAPPRDMSTSHLQFAAAQRVLGAGLMKTTPDGAFEPWRLVTGADAEALVHALARMTATAR
jgi:tetratricopeptide (TPR) repeat protein